MIWNNNMNSSITVQVSCWTQGQQELLSKILTGQAIKACDPEDWNSEEENLIDCMLARNLKWPLIHTYFDFEGDAWDKVQLIENAARASTIQYSISRPNHDETFVVEGRLDPYVHISVADEPMQYGSYACLHKDEQYGEIQKRGNFFVAVEFPEGTIREIVNAAKLEDLVESLREDGWAIQIND